MSFILKIRRDYKERKLRSEISKWPWKNGSAPTIRRREEILNCLTTKEEFLKFRRQE